VGDELMDEMKDLELQLEALRRDLSQARERASQHEGMLSELDERRAETADRLEIALRQVDEFRDELERKETELEEARREAALAEIEEAAERRDEAARKVAAAITTVIEGLDELDGLRDDLARVRSTHASDGHLVDVADEPAEFGEAIERLVSLVRGMLDETLEDELLEAAARSSRPRAIDELPPHLQEAARLRRRRLAKQRWDS
jgi:chromosome segregation ATPase